MTEAHIAQKEENRDCEIIDKQKRADSYGNLSASGSNECGLTCLKLYYHALSDSCKSLYQATFDFTLLDQRM